VLDKAVPLIPGEMLDIAHRPGDEIVDRDDSMPSESRRSVRCEPRKPAPPVTTEIGEDALRVNIGCL
jgi:hypothetical protein